MQVSGHIKKLGSALLLLMTLWIALPKVYLHNLFHHGHQKTTVTKETSLEQQQATDDCDFDEYNKPVYFNLFTFISKLLPLKPQHSGTNTGSGFHLPGLSVLQSLLRAPPALAY